jgi:hypothetical protein
MAVQVTITRKDGNVAFEPDPTTLAQSELVFWSNSDTEPHFPIPGCSGLEVAPNASSPPFQPAPQPTFPATIVYQCAIPEHTEKGTLTIHADPTPTTPVAPGTSPQTRNIDIKQGGVFSEVNLTQEDSVVWHNLDSRPHWPVPNCSGLKVAPGSTSNALQPAPTPTLPMALVYGCAIAGHESESGTINVYKNFLVVASSPAAPVTVSSALPYASVPVATGGMSPYQAGGSALPASPDPTYSFLTLVETPTVGSSTGISIVLNAAPPSGITYPISYPLNVTDASGKSINQTISITVT